MKLHIIAAIVDTKELTMYLKDGSTKKIPQGDPMLAKVLGEITPQLIQNKEAFYDLVEPDNRDEDYIEFEGRTNGVVKFFRIMKSKIADFMANAEPTEVASVAPVELNAEATRMQNVINEIVNNARPMTEDKVSEEETIVAVVNNNSVVTDVHNLKNQIAESNKTQSIGMENFMKRVAAVANKRQHSVQDLMKFMQRGDLPIADDGSIIIYKVLTKQVTPGHTYVDCHTKKVPQSVGTYVCMDETLVDHDRRNECSNGLHVARRAYIGNFSGDVCVLAKVAPEDVIAVPSYDANKMRVCGYHILFELPEDSYRKVKANTTMTDDDIGKILLGKAMSGDHVGKLVEVRVTRQAGEGVVIKNLMEEKQAEQSLVANVITSVDSKAESISTEVEEKPVMPKAKVVTPKDVIKEVAETQTALQSTMENLPKRVQTAQALYKAYLDATEDNKEKTFAELQEFKRNCKCSWSTLGLPDFTVQKTEKKAKTPTPVVAKPKVPLTRSEKALEMLKNIRTASAVEKPVLARELLEFKKKTKTGFETLGLSSKDVSYIMKLSQK